MMGLEYLKTLFGIDCKLCKSILISIHLRFYKTFKVEKILEDSLDSIPSPSLSVKIQNIGGKVYLIEIIRQNIAG